MLSSCSVDACLLNADLDGWIGDGKWILLHNVHFLGVGCGAGLDLKCFDTQVRLFLK